MCVLRSSRSSRGALLLEAIVAMTILSTAGLLLMSWMQQSLETVTRLEQVDRDSSLEANALALVERINPMQEPSGELVLEAMRVRWTSTELQPPRPIVQAGMQLGGGQPVFQAGLYKLTVLIEPGTPAGPSRQLEIVRIGWRAPAGRSGEGPPR